MPFLIWGAITTSAPSDASPGGTAPAVRARTDNVVETLHGVKVADPYRWLEDEGAAEVVAWTAAQNALTRRVLDGAPGRAELEARLWSLHEIGSLGAPVPRPVGRGRGRTWRYFHTRRDGKQNQPVLYVRDGLNGADRALVDVNGLASDGTQSLDWWFPSEDGRLVAYGVSANGSEQSMLRVRDVVSGKDLPETISRTRSCSVAWLPDSSGFYYTRYPAPGTVPPGEESYHRHVFLHRLGTAGSDADADAQIFGVGRQMEDWPSVALSPDGRFLGIQVNQGWSKTELYVLDRAAAGTVIPVAVGREAVYDLAEITDDALFIRTDEGAPRYRLFRVPLPRPRGPLAKLRARPAAVPAAAPVAGAAEVPALPRSTWRELIPEGPHVLQQIALVGDTVAALYLDNAASRVLLFDAAVRSRARGSAAATLVAPAGGEVALPMLGTVGGIFGHAEGTELFLPFTSFLSPTTILRQPLGRRKNSAMPVRPPAAQQQQKQQQQLQPQPQANVWLQIPSPLPPDAFVVTRDNFPSADGTSIPLFLVHRRDLAKAGGNIPTVLYGYGGFNVSITPIWTPSIVPFLEKGGVYAVAVLRGGGEFGESWHRAGMLDRKQNVFDDFIGAAKHLIATGITTPARLAITGRSNGGLLVGAALTQRPDLFRAALCGVPLLDMLRYHKFRIAKLWIPEYGSADDPAAFKWLHAYSPYHRVRDAVPYPAVMFVTAASDTRVDPLHARKMTARLQAATTSQHPVLLRLETQAGHGAGKPLAKVIAQLVDEWSFLFAQLE